MHHFVRCLLGEGAFSQPQPIISLIKAFYTNDDIIIINEKIDRYLYLNGESEMCKDFKGLIVLICLFIFSNTVCASLCSNYAGGSGNIQKETSNACYSYSTNASTGSSMQTNQQCQEFCDSVQLSGWCNTATSNGSTGACLNIPSEISAACICSERNISHGSCRFSCQVWNPASKSCVG